jgi:hypothetical protein
MRNRPVLNGVAKLLRQIMGLFHTCIGQNYSEFFASCLFASRLTVFPCAHFFPLPAMNISY